MHLVHHADARKFRFLDLVQQTLAGPETGLTSFEVWLVTLKPGGESPPHHHLGDTAWVILQGHGRAVVAGEAVQVGPETTLSIPAGASRQLFNTGDEELLVLTIRASAPSSEAGPSEPGR
jgi:mannose-6-phosphate isomerase-like protein (cupin superfamily)